MTTNCNRHFKIEASKTPTVFNVKNVVSNIIVASVETTPTSLALTSYINMSHKELVEIIKMCYEKFFGITDYNRHFKIEDSNTPTVFYVKNVISDIIVASIESTENSFVLTSYINMSHEELDEIIKMCHEKFFNM